MPILTDSIWNILRIVENADALRLPANTAMRCALVAAISTAHDAAEAVESDERFAKLESDIRQANTKLEDAQLTIERLRQQQAQQHPADRPEPEHKILLLLKTGEKLTVAEIAASLHISDQSALHHLTELRKLDKFISEILPDWNSRLPIQWKLWDNGRAYLNERGLL